MVSVNYSPCQQMIAVHWCDALCRLYPDRSAASIEAEVQTATDCLYAFLSGSPVTWDLRRLMVLLTPQPSFSDMTQVIIALRMAVRSALADSDAQTMLWMSEKLDRWVVEVVTHYDRMRLRQTEKRWRDMVERLAQLNTLSHCVAELNTSLDLASAFSATVELARLLSGADVCVLYQQEGDMLRMRAFSGSSEPPLELVPITGAGMLEQVVVDRHHHDVPIEVIRQRMGIPAVCAVHCMPLQTNNVTTGKLTFACFTETTFTLQELRLQEIFANHAAQAIYNAQLYERLSALTAANERRQIACEMHDTLLQTLITLNINLRVMHNHAQRGAWGEVLPLIEAAQHLGKVAIQEGRDTLNDLRADDTSQLERSLTDALQPEIASFAASAAIHPRFTCREELYVPANVSHHLCRLVGEALTNIHRHASASSVQVCIDADDDQLSIRVRDDGVGFQPGRVDQRNSFGLMGMHERARLINAQVIVDSAPGCGTTVTITCPLPSANGSR